MFGVGNTLIFERQLFPTISSVPSTKGVSMSQSSQPDRRQQIGELIPENGDLRVLRTIHRETTESRVLISIIRKGIITSQSIVIHFVTLHPAIQVNGGIVIHNVIIALLQNKSFPYVLELVVRIIENLFWMRYRWLSNGRRGTLCNCPCRLGFSVVSGSIIHAVSLQLKNYSGAKSSKSQTYTGPSR